MISCYLTELCELYDMQRIASRDELPTKEKVSLRGKELLLEETTILRKMF